MIYARHLKDGKEVFEQFQDKDIETVKSLDLLVPVKPSKIIAVGLNYLDHIKEFGDRDVPENPTLFVKLPHTVIGPNETIILPKGYERVDYEAELAVVIKKHCFNVEPEEVKEYILGYTCANDVTERTVQRKDGQWIRGKNFPTFCPIGPYIVSDIDCLNIDIKSYLNGELKQSSNLKYTIWNPYELISFISKSIPLEENDVVITGTPEGVGPMNDGDEIIVEIQSVGKLINKVSK